MIVVAILDSHASAKKGTIRGRESRNQTLTTKLTEDERRVVEEAATAEATTTGEWLRDLALRAARRGSDTAVLAEVVGVRLLLVNVLRSLAAGQKMAPEAFDKLLDEIGNTKHELAGKLAVEGRH